MIRGSAAAAQNDGLRFAVETSTTASARSPASPLDSVRQYMVELELMTREPGWDAERGAPVHSRAWNRARVFLEKCLEEIAALPMPDVSASGDGYVHFVWFSAGRRAVMEIGDEHAHWTLLSRDAPIVDENVELREAIEKLRNFLRGE